MRRNDERDRFENTDRYNNEWDGNRNNWNSNRNNFASGNRNQFQDNNSDDDDTESVPYRVMERKYDYEVRQYETSKWICTQETKDLDDDPYRNWRNRFPNGREAMREIAKEQKRKDKETMFRKLFKYIVGVNKEAWEIDMTRPVTTKRTRLVLNREKHEMCFWAGSEWANRQLPEPINDEVYIKTRDPMQVFVRRFPGYALSSDDWTDELKLLANDIRNRQDVDTSGTYYTAGYSGPWTEASDRINEVWIKRMPREDTFSSSFQEPESNFWSKNTFNSGEKTSDDLAEMIQHTVVEENDVSI